MVLFDVSPASCLRGNIEDITWLGRDGQFIFDS